MAKKEVKEEKPKLFYYNKDKYDRAVKMVDQGDYKKVKEAYEALGGVFMVGYGYKEV